MEELTLEKLTVNLYRSWLKINELFFYYVNSKGLSYNSIVVLWIILDSSHGITQNEICMRSFIPKQTVNKIIKSFVKKNYIVFERDECNKKNKKVFLTQLGEEYVILVIEPLKKIEEKAMNELLMEKITRILYQFSLENDLLN